MSSIIKFVAGLAKMTGNNKQIKGYKVTNVSRTKKVGIACRNFKELKQKARVKLNLPSNEDIGIFLPDGSEIDEDYFATLEPQTTLIVLRPGEKLLTEADILYDLLRKVNEDFFKSGDEAENFLTEKLKIKVAILNRALNKDDSKTEFSRKEDHPEWFEGLETCATTKEAYLHKRCQERIRGYLYKAIEQIRASEVFLKNTGARKQLLQVISFMKLQLKQDHFFGYYFDRSRALPRPESESDDETDGNDDGNCTYEHCPCHLTDSQYDRFVLGLNINDAREDNVDAKKVTDDSDEVETCPFKLINRNKRVLMALCDYRGEFRCGGLWNSKDCAYGGRHAINPYRSKEELILFSTWNLDHKIERSRTLVPQLLEVAKKGKINEKCVVEFYNNLFTTKNLKLVHIICHDKGSHN